MSSSSPLRWVGGKQRMAGLLSRLDGDREGRLIDPFVGGGSSLFIFQRSSFLAGETNEDLVNFYQQVRDAPAAIYRRLVRLADTEETFKRVRAASPTDTLERAVRFLYLNRTAYMGMYRVNRSGRFNVPYGGGGRMDLSRIRAQIEVLSGKLGNGSIDSQDFRVTLAKAETDDLIFVDPPYTDGGSQTFNRYGSSPFLLSDHADLAMLLNQKAAVGTKIIATVPASHEILSGYVGWGVCELTFSSRLPRGEAVLCANGPDQNLLGKIRKTLTGLAVGNAHSIPQRGTSATL